jgi:hypothetical protein
VAPLGARPSTSHDRRSPSGTGGCETSCTFGLRTVPLTCTPASTAWLRRQAVICSDGLSIGPSKITTPGSTCSVWP